MLADEQVLDVGFAMPPRVESFPPIAQPDARLLILGSMPGIASLQAGQYYAHPQNRFWKFLGSILGFDPALPYEQRVAYLQEAGIALWDVLASCHRPGSLDADIHAPSVVANDLAGFLARHPSIQRICFNGAAAEKLFRRHVLPELDLGRIEIRLLPSTSPANASIPLLQKQAAWSEALQILTHQPD